METLDAFSDGEFGTTLSRRLLHSLALKGPEAAHEMLGKALRFHLIEACFRSSAEKLSQSDLTGWLGMPNPEFEYQYGVLLAYVHDELGIEHSADLSTLLMTSALAARHYETAESIATDVLRVSTAAKNPGITWRSYDILGRIAADQSRFNEASERFRAGARAAHEAGLPRMEWDQETNLIWCLYVQQNYVAALDEIGIAERLARDLNDLRCIAKSLIDRGNTELMLGNRAKATEAYKGALDAAEQGDDITIQSDALGNLGGIAQAEKRYADAEEWHRRSLRISTTLTDRNSEQYDWNNLAQALAAQGKTEEAVEAQQESLKLARLRQDPEYILRYSERLKQLQQLLGRYQTTARELPSQREAKLRAIREPARRAAATMDVLEKQVRQLLNEKNMDGALSAVTSHLEGFPESFKAHLLYALLLGVSGQDSEAAAQIELALTIEPDSLDAYYRLVDIYTRMKRLAELEPRLAEDNVNDPFRAGPRLALSVLYVRTDRFDEAIQQAQEAVLLSDGDELALRVLAEAQFGNAYDSLNKNWDGAWLAFQDAAATLARLVSIESAQRGQWLYFAAQWFERFAMASHRASPPFIVTMDVRELTILAHAWRYYLRAQESDTLRHTEQDLNRLTQTIMASAGPAEVTTAAGQLRSDGYFEDALMMLILSLRMDQDQPEAHFQLALTYRALAGSRSGEVGIQDLDRALELDPENQEYLETRRSWLKDREGQDLKSGE